MWELGPNQNAGTVAPACRLMRRAATFAARPPREDASNAGALSVALRPHYKPGPV
ncbi:MAG: hypothetical protein Kow0063_29800 [Anaerolineae bacterium]